MKSYERSKKPKKSSLALKNPGLVMDDNKATFTLDNTRTIPIGEHKVETFCTFKAELTSDYINQIVKKELQGIFDIGQNACVTVEQNFDREGPLEGFNVKIEISKVTFIEAMSIRRKNV